jgi:hypothetical protein
MAKNRKNQPAAIRFGPAVKAFLLCLLIGGSGVGYVWQKNQIYELGRQIKQREIRLATLQYQNKKLHDQLAMLRSPAMLDRRVRELNLGMGVPRATQYLWLSEPSPPAASQTTGGATARQFASNDAGDNVAP